MVTIPTIDQIGGTTVMNKMRSLIHAFINFATEIDADLTVISTQASNAYDLAMNTAGQFADLQALVQNNYYTKSETDTLLGRRAYQFNVTAPLYKIQYSAYEDSVGIHFDGETIINGSSGLEVNMSAIAYSGGVGTNVNLAREININLSDGLYVNTNNALMAKVDGETIKFNSNGVMHVPIDNSTIKVDADTGLISADIGGSDWELVTTTDWVTGIVSIDNDEVTFLKDVMIMRNTGVSNVVFMKNEIIKTTDTIYLDSMMFISRIFYKSIKFSISEIFNNNAVCNGEEMSVIIELNTSTTSVPTFSSGAITSRVCDKVINNSYIGQATPKIKMYVK